MFEWGRARSVVWEALRAVLWADPIPEPFRAPRRREAAEVTLEVANLCIGFRSFTSFFISPRCQTIKTAAALNYWHLLRGW